MAENNERKIKYLASRFPDVPVFEDASDLHKSHARCANGKSCAVEKAGLCPNKSQAITPLWDCGVSFLIPG